MCFLSLEVSSAFAMIGLWCCDPLRMFSHSAHTWPQSPAHLISVNTTLECMSAVLRLAWKGGLGHGTCVPAVSKGGAEPCLSRRECVVVRCWSRKPMRWSLLPSPKFRKCQCMCKTRCTAENKQMESTWWRKWFLLLRCVCVLAVC